MQLSRALSRKEDPKAKILYVNHALLMKLIKEYSFFTHFCFFRVDPLCAFSHILLYGFVYAVTCSVFHQCIVQREKGVEGIAHFEEVQMQQSTKWSALVSSVITSSVNVKASHCLLVVIFSSLSHTR